VSVTEPPDSANEESATELTANIPFTQCPNCGLPYTAGSRFCSSCGVALTGTTETGALPAADESGPIPLVDPELLTGVAPGDAVLVIHRGPEQGTKFELKGELLTAGRGPDATIFFDDVTVSRRHVEFTHSPQGWTVADVGSLNGSYVNRNRIDQHLLVTGDEVQIGKYRFLFFQVPS